MAFVTVIPGLAEQDSELMALILRGLWLTINLTAITTTLSLVLGVGVGTALLSPCRWIRTPAVLYVELHRNVPAVVLIIFWAFAVPNLFTAEQRQSIFFDNDFVNSVTALTGASMVYYTFAAVLALSLNTSAYLAEIFRAGVGVISAQHTETARTLGATRNEVYWTLLLPKGLSAAFPAVTARLVHNMKNTSLAALVSVPELFHSTESAISLTFQPLRYLLLASLLYLTIGAALTHLLGQFACCQAAKPQPYREITTGVGND